MRRTLIVFASLAVILLAVKINNPATFRPVKPAQPSEETRAAAGEETREISDVVKPGETFFDIFKNNGLDMAQLLDISEASAGVYNLRRISSGSRYRITVSPDEEVEAVTYSIDDDSYLSVTRTDEGFSAEKLPVQYERRISQIGGTITSNLVSSMDDLVLALELSDVFAWDIDFTTDIREGDSYRVVVEELWLDGQFKKYGAILSAEFINNGQAYEAYRFEQDGEADYYDARGKSLRRAFLKAPLSYRRISSGFSRRRFHPVLRIYRPHLGIDYAAPTGTPVSAVGDGTVVSAGYRGQNGRQVVIRHAGGYRTYYGHLSRIARGIRRGVKVRQGKVIGYVGSTGLATGPHLDYRIKLNGRFVNPLRLDMPRGEPVRKSLMADFESYKARMDERLASIPVMATADAPDRKGTGRKGG